jgi:phosphoenolpyruvate-protein phosphotransferase (PTS system enzyme I)
VRRATACASCCRPTSSGSRTWRRRSAGAEGIGLYRSEFLLAGGPPDMATEEEQYDVYRQLVERMAPRPVTIRTFDVDERQLARP